MTLQHKVNTLKSFNSSVSYLHLLFFESDDLMREINMGTRLLAKAAHLPNVLIYLKMTEDVNSTKTCRKLRSSRESMYFKNYTYIYIYIYIFCLFVFVFCLFVCFVT